MLVLIAGAWLALGPLGSQAAPPHDRGEPAEPRVPPRASPGPNLVVILADDLGWPDLGWTVGRCETPNIDRLADEGVRLTHVYTEPLCTPSRAALLTGRYPHRYGLAGCNLQVFTLRALPQSERLLSERLHDLGYSTAICGKWHLGNRSLEEIPNSRGFDHQYGCYSGMIDYDTHLWAEKVLDWYRDNVPLVEEGYATDLIAAEACRLLRERPREQPIFLYVPFNAPHGPHDAPPRYVEEYAYLKKPCLVNYAAMVRCLDDGVGRILDTLSELGMRDDTLVVFLSDNGAPVTEDFLDNRPLRNGKLSGYEGGVRTPGVMSWPGMLPAGEVYDGPMHLVDVCATLLSVAGSPPSDWPELDGHDLWPQLFGGEPIAEYDVPISVGSNYEALLHGRWKLTRHRGKRVELFDLERDPFELHDLSKEKSVIRDALLARLDRYVREAVPTPRGISARDPETLPASWAPTGEGEDGGDR